MTIRVITLGGGTIDSVQGTAQTVSAANNDSIFLLINVTTGAYDTATWTQALAVDEDTSLSLAVAIGDKIAIVQIQEDGTTEFAGGSFYLEIDS